MSSSKAVVTGFIGLVLGCILASVFLRQCVRCDTEKVETISDTLIIVDTVTERYPVPIKETVTDTVLVAVRDTVMLRDTAYIVLGMTQRYYRGPGYEAWVSGYRPRLDSCRVFPSTVYINSSTVSREPVRRWGLGIQAGYGMGLSDGQVKAFPYIGVGISWNFIRF
ncbi:MAG TPA: hypothetical protein IAC03_00335 [Candidatus Coprenecus pullistercoris]|nr:hypothetical protein [Candidatus Coprenecus pullistercoris]